MSKAVSAKKPYCKVCYDAGKPEKEYTSHWVKDTNGKIICSTLLNTECRFCHKLGHTAKFCDAIKKRVNYRSEYVPKKEKKEKKENIIIASNKFQILDDDMEDEEKIEFEAPVVTTIIPRKECWADIAAKPKKIEEKVVKLTENAYSETPLFRRRWADWTDSEDEDDMDDLSQKVMMSQHDSDDDWY